MKHKKSFRYFMLVMFSLFVLAPAAIVISDAIVERYVVTEETKVSTVMFVNHGGKCYIVDAVDMDFYQEIDCNPEITNLIANTPVGHGHGITTNHLFFGRDSETGECFSAVGAGVNKRIVDCTAAVLALVVEGAVIIE